MNRNASGLTAARSPSAEAAAHDSPELANPDQGAAVERDRIAAAYLGRWGTATTQRRTRDRIDWMAAQARGPRILDIGCSEGILALLLARAGHRVVGIDVEPAAIAAAQDLIKDEPAVVREGIELHVGDALSEALGDRKFDTVVLGEVLEHLADPAAMLERAASLLDPGGRLVLTTPFGYFPHPDHRQEFRTTQLVSLLGARFVIDELSMVDGCFRVIAHALSAPVLQERRAPDVHHLLVMTEEAAIAAQKHLTVQLALRSRRLSVTIERARELAEKESRLLEKESRLLEKESRLLEKVELLGEKEKALTERVRRLGRHLEHQKRITATARARIQQMQAQLKQQQQGLLQELGRAVDRSLRSPLGVLRLPWRIAKAYRRERRRAMPPASAKASPIRRPQFTPKRIAALTTTKNQRRESRPPAPRPHRDLSSAFPPYPFPDRRPRSPLRVATILDEFSDSCFRYEANLVRLSKEEWRKEIERERPEFLFVESAWRGNHGSWEGLIKNADHTLDNPLEALVDLCKGANIPTVFWNKEDPPNFERFIDAAAKFDYVFTTDADCIDHYRARLGHDRVAALPFAAQPAIHNPIGKEESDEFEIAFAGTWYGQKHEERGALLPILLDAAREHRLHIFDRMSRHTRNDNYHFPEKYAACLRSALPYPNVLTAYRRFKLFLNVNSVTDSPTMFARRVFEILASSTAVVSTASTGIEQMLGEVVAVVHDEDEARRELDRLLADPVHRRRKAHLGYRRVMREHSYAARFQTLARKIGGIVDEDNDLSATALVIPLQDERWLDNALANLRRQRHLEIAPVWVVERPAARRVEERIKHATPRATVVEIDAGASWAAMLRRGVAATSGALVGALDPRDVYGPEFLGDLALALSYAEADVVGKAAHFAAAAIDAAPNVSAVATAYRYGDRLLGGAWLARRAAFARGALEIVSADDGRPAIANGNGAGRLYGADPFNYVRLESADPPPPAALAELDAGRVNALGLDAIIF